MKPDLHPTVRTSLIALAAAGAPRLVPLVVMAAAAAFVQCNLALGLENYIDCPQDPSCPPGAACMDGLQNGNETDVDCGGPACNPCALGKKCKVPTDCATNVCTDQRCAPAATCGDGIKNEDETAVDCGGTKCPPCADHDGCLVGPDCMSGVCIGGACAAPTCGDGVKNGDESDVDCGGSCGATCGFGKSCGGDADCKGGSCSSGKCAATCTDGEKDGAETGTDCGGGACPVCPDGQGCSVNGDCANGVCHGGTCTNPYIWSKKFGDAVPNDANVVHSVAVDASGNVVFTGALYGTVDFGGGPLTSAGFDDLYVVKLDKDGNHVWSNRYGDGNGQMGTALTVDEAGDVILGGSSRSGFDIGGTFVAADGVGLFGDIFVAKFDEVGHPVWATRGTSGGGANVVVGVTADSAGNIFATGQFTNSTAFYGLTPVISLGVNDAFLVKLSSDGQAAWLKNFGTPSLDSGRGVGVNAAGNVVIVAISEGALNLGGGSLGNAGGEDIYVGKFDTTGTYQWGKRFGDQADQGDVRVAIDGSGDIILAGVFQGTIDFGGGSLTSAGANDFFVAKLDASGAHLWSKRFGDANDQTMINVTVDELGNVLLSGAFQGSVDFGGGPLVSAGGSVGGDDIFVAKLGPSGNHLWSRRFGDSLVQSCYGVASAGSGKVVVAGGFDGILDFSGTTPLTNTAFSSDYVAKLQTP